MNTPTPNEKRLQLERIVSLGNMALADCRIGPLLAVDSGSIGYPPGNADAYKAALLAALEVRGPSYKARCPAHLASGRDVTVACDTVPVVDALLGRVCPRAGVAAGGEPQ